MGALSFLVLYLKYTYHTPEQNIQICGRMVLWEFWIIWKMPGTG